MDVEIVERARAGDSRALEELFRMVTPPLTALATRMTRDDALAEELVLEALERGGLEIGRLRESGAALGWFRRILVNRWRDRLRASRALDASLEDVTEPEASLESDPGARLDAGELRERVDRALGVLPPLQRLVLTLVADEGLRVAEIAELLDESPSRVKANLWHARQRLRRELRDLLDPNQRPIQ